MISAERHRVVRRIADHLAAVAPAHPVRVAVAGSAAATATFVAEFGDAVVAVPANDAAAEVAVDLTDPERPVLRRIGGAATDTVRLFSYGTLRQPEVQLSTFGRELTGTSDTLPGWLQGWVTITDPAVVAASGSDRHPFARPSDDPTDAVAGTVFELDAAELAAADLYEVDDYTRVRVRLGSGGDAWFYRAAG